MAPQISIITPCLNQAAFLPHTLASVAEQRGVNAEHLIFDPGSFDGSRAIIRAHAGGHPDTRVFFERDAGPADAINKGVSRANADIVGWLGADDFYAGEDVLAQVCGAFENHPDIDVVYIRCTHVDRNGGEQAKPAAFEPDGAGIAEILTDRDVFANGAAFFRRALINRVGPLNVDASPAYDFEFWLCAAGAGTSFLALPNDGLRRRVHAESASRLLGGARAMACARATRAQLGRAGTTWIRRAIEADVAAPRPTAMQSREQAIANLCAGVERRLNRSQDASDFLALLGNGPSLKDFDFENLRDVDALGMNAAYRHWRTINWYPRYYACLDEVLGVSHRDAIEEMVLQADQRGMDLFFLCGNLIKRLSPEAQRSTRLIDFDAIGGQGGLLDCAPWTTGSHAALFAALLGYRALFILGVDCNYVEVVDGAEAKEDTVLELAQTPEQNPNYFFDGYQVAGDRYNVPNPVPDMHLNCWRDVAARLAAREVSVWNGSIASRVDVFPRLSFAQARQAGSAPVAVR